MTLPYFLKVMEAVNFKMFYYIEMVWASLTFDICVHVTLHVYCNDKSPCNDEAMWYHLEWKCETMLAVVKKHIEFIVLVLPLIHLLRFYLITCGQQSTRPMGLLFCLLVTSVVKRS